MKSLHHLNKQQQQAVQSINGPILIIAGAGSGKTLVLTHRLAYLVAQGIAPENILAVTFTNKAAAEMKQRVHSLLSEKRQAESVKNKTELYASRYTLYANNVPFIGTFHSFCLKLLRQERYPWSNFTIYDEDDKRDLIKDILRQSGQDKIIKVTSLNEHISKAKNELIGPKEYGLWVESDYERKVILPLYALYQEKLTTARALDFDDLLLQAVKLLKISSDHTTPRRRHPDPGLDPGEESYQKNPALEKYQNQYQYILVDEYQDVNTAQYQILKLLAATHGNICVVGDVDQAIYNWRGADFRNILNFEQDYPNAKVIKLEENYRSTQTILAAANHVVERNTMRKPKNLWTSNNEGEKLIVAGLSNPESEADFVIEQILRLQDTGYRLHDMVILYRTNAQSRALEEACLRASLPYKLIGAYRFYERKEVKDLLSYLRLVENPDDLQSWKRIINMPPRGLTLPKDFWQQRQQEQRQQERQQGPSLLPFLLPLHKQTVLEKLQNQFVSWRTAKKSIKTSLLVQKVMDESGYLAYLKDGTEESEDRLLNLIELLNIARSFDDFGQQGIQKFLESVALIQETDRIEPAFLKQDGQKKDVLHLMTLHMAKGLEFNVVFITGMEEGLCPHERSKTMEELEEERRLCYVGMTRAKQKLYLTFAQQRNLWFSKSTASPSRFLFDIPKELYEFEDYTGADTLEEKQITIE